MSGSRFKIKAFLVRNPAMSPNEFRAHYEQVHLPLALRTFPEIVEHRRNYPAPDGTHLPEGSMAHWDAISDIWFADSAGFALMVKRLQDDPATDAIKADELRFLDRDRCGMMIVDEVVSTRT